MCKRLAEVSSGGETGGSNESMCCLMREVMTVMLDVQELEV